MRRNLIFIFTDQQRADTLGCYGSQLGATPNLDQLATESVVFENAYVTQPTCTPSRASIMTGLYPHNHGATRNNVPLQRETKTIAEMVSPDYHCAYFGKWHLGDEIVAQHGFDQWASIEDNYRDHYSDTSDLQQFSDYHHYLIEQGYEPDMEAVGAPVFSRLMTAALPEQHTKARFLGRHAAEFLRSYEQQHGDDQPFILYVGFLEPHPPYISPLSDQYPPDHLPTNETFYKQPATNAALVNRLRAQNYMQAGFRNDQDLTDPNGGRSIASHYIGNVDLVDRAVGDILDALSEAGLDSETMVVFSSDHGEMLGNHGMFAKFVMYEGSVRVPLLVKVPWLANAIGRIDGRISQVDLVPTLLGLLEQPAADDLDGVNRAAVVGEPQPLTDDVFIEWNGPNGRPGKLFEGGVPLTKWAAVQGAWRTIISADGWKLALSRHDRCELYDLNDDPHEQHNLFDDPAHLPRIIEMTSRVRQWQIRTGDDEPLPDWIGRSGVTYWGA